MAHDAQILQQHNTELVKLIEDLCQKRDQLQKAIIEEDDEKNRLQHDMRIISEKLAKINDSLSKKLVVRNSYDKAIAESQQAYSKLLENSYGLLNVLKCNQEKMKDKFAKTYNS
ncbi:unnamed protein product [Schistosoma haematobium]|uniref:Sjoegren syndrome nuclear autoantigen 1 n=1 Tax=Schistosoma curassoni TaxID=6186 RepID=A0A183K9Y0_9TREM|nr:unnamed protein product [Schistosoma haematobium]VDP46174.1 unnamed protein product [Schistosoma curassoni]